MTERLHFRFSLSCIGEGNGNPLQCSCPENPRDRGAWWAAVYGVTQSRTRLKWLSSSSSYIPWSFLFLPLCAALLCPLSKMATSDIWTAPPSRLPKKHISCLTAWWSHFLKVLKGLSRRHMDDNVLKNVSKAFLQCNPSSTLCFPCAIFQPCPKAPLPFASRPQMDWKQSWQLKLPRYQVDHLIYKRNPTGFFNKM